MKLESDQSPKFDLADLDMEEEKSPNIASFHEGNSSESLRQEVDDSVSDEESEENIQSRFVRDSFIDHTTGRRRQILICRQCGLRTPKLCNMRDHIMSHISFKPYKCNMCGKAYV